MAAPAGIAAILAILAACGGLAALLTATRHLALLDAYLATTPGGINAVLVAAFASGANTAWSSACKGYGCPSWCWQPPSLSGSSYSGKGDLPALRHNHHAFVHDDPGRVTHRPYRLRHMARRQRTLPQNRHGKAVSSSPVGQISIIA